MTSDRDHTQSRPMARSWIHVALALIIAITTSWSAAHPRGLSGYGADRASVVTPCEMEECDCDKAQGSSSCNGFAVCVYSNSHLAAAVSTVAPLVRVAHIRRPLSSSERLEGSATRPPDIRPPIA